MTAQRIKGRIFALLAMMVAFVSCAVTATPALADVTGGTTTFNKYLVMDENANVPNVTFGFTITAGTAAAGDGSTLPIYAGIGSPTVSEAVFSAEDNTTPGMPANRGATGYKYATDEVTVDFSSVSFDSPGIYRYIITETASNAAGIIYDTPDTRTLDVYVQYGENDDLTVVNSLLYKGDVSNDNKSDGFTNKYTTYDLTLKKKVTGNQGDRDKYFKFTVSISEAVAGTVYKVDRANAYANPTVDGEPKTNPESLMVGAGGTISGTFYLKNGQFIVIQGLTSDTKYTISEEDYSTDGYSTSWQIDSGTQNARVDTGSQTMGTANHTVTFTNSKSGTVPTGILLETGPYLIMGGVVVVALVALVATRRRRAR